jgi:hypothetical protein
VASAPLSGGEGNSDAAGLAAGEEEVPELASWAVGVQRRHVEMVCRASLALAREEAREHAA